MQRRSFLSLLAAGAALPLTGIAARAEAQTIRIGTASGFDTEILAFVKKAASAKGLDLQTEGFNDQAALCAALDAGQIAGAILDQVRLADEIRKHGYKLAPTGITTNTPFGIYSRHFKTWDEIPAGTTIAIPNDPYNRSRTLTLLRDRSAITLREGAGPELVLRDIVRNPKALRFLEIPASETPNALRATSLDGAGTAAVLAFYARLEGLPAAEAIFTEDREGPYASVLAVRASDTGKPWINRFFAAYRTADTKAFIGQKFDGLVIAGW